MSITMPRQDVSNGNAMPLSTQIDGGAAASRPYSITLHFCYETLAPSPSVSARHPGWLQSKQYTRLHYKGNNDTRVPRTNLHARQDLHKPNTFSPSSTSLISRFATRPVRAHGLTRNRIASTFSWKLTALALTSQQQDVLLSSSQTRRELEHRQQKLRWERYHY